jgi:hypothetical protein
MRGPRPTRRSSERAPAGTPSGDAGAPGGWHPQLTFHVSPLLHAPPHARCRHAGLDWLPV